MNVEWTADQRAFVQKAIESGRFSREEEAVQEALARGEGRVFTPPTPIAYRVPWNERPVRFGSRAILSTGTCGTVSGSTPSALASRRATWYSASVAALFRRNSAFRMPV
jgi:hypothetical protein